jgi:CheY-like chemotaxis protein
MSHILIVEDETATAWAVAESLRDDGHRTTSVVSAEEDGIRLARRLRSARQPLPIIVLTAYGTRQAIDELESCGVHAVFSKPFRVDQLRRTVRDALVSNDPASVGNAVKAADRGEEA